MLHIYIDGDACPVKSETYRVAARYGLDVTAVVNRPIRVPEGARVALQVVGGGFDAADDWIASRAGEGDIVITADIPLAARCLALGAAVLGTSGREFTEDGIGDALAAREIADLRRQMGEITGGPAAMDAKSRSRFLARLDEIVNRVKRDAR
jgi:uncharacterized protein